jgi:Phycobilisome protein
MTSSQLSPKVLELIQKSRIVSFDRWQDTYPPEILSIFQAADDERRYLTDRDLLVIPDSWPAAVLRDNATAIVDTARALVLASFPTILAPGGELYPAARAEACWRDFWQFLRCVTYGIAGGRTDYLSPVGLRYMNELYQELQVPLPAMVVGLQSLKSSSLLHLSPGQEIAPCFDVLIAQLQKFQ